MNAPSPSSRPSIVIGATRGWIQVPWREIWDYRELFWQFVCRDFSARYRQTMLGPAWFIFQPLLMTAVFTIVFGRIARLQTDNVPPPLFYLCGLLSWSYFAQSVPMLAGTFTANAHLFGKTYFPRLTIPLSNLVGNLVSLGMQGVAFVALWIYYRSFTDFGSKPMLSPFAGIGLLALAQTQIVLLSLGVGSLLAATTGKYRDLQHVVPVLIQLWFYATPIVYPLSMISSEARWRWIATLNPMTAPCEAMKLALVGHSSWTPTLALGAWATTCVLLLLGLAAFSRAERTVVDVA